MLLSFIEGENVTITFSPCIDKKSTSIPELLPEKKLKRSTPKLEPGGGGINVASALKTELCKKEDVEKLFTLIHRS